MYRRCEIPSRVDPKSNLTSVRSQHVTQWIEPAEPEEDYYQPDEEQLNESELQEDYTQPSPTAEDIVSASLASGTLSEVCEVAGSLQVEDSKEEANVLEFVEGGVGVTMARPRLHAPCCSLSSTIIPSVRRLLN